jgi:hypothetical protein
MAISIPSVTVLNGDGVDAAAAILRRGSAQEIITAAEKEAASPPISSFISNISSSGQAKLSLESLQAKAEALKNAAVPPTLDDFKVVVQGVVSGINSVRATLVSALTESGSGSQAIARAKEFVDRIAAGNKDEDAVALAKKIGIERQADGGFAVNQKQLKKTFNEDDNGAFSALTEFAAKLAEAKDVPEPDKKEYTERSKDVARKSEGKVQQNQPQQADVRPQGFQIELDSASSFTAQTAVASYLTVAAL